MANPLARPPELAKTTYARVHAAAETTEQLLDALRAVEEALFELERYAGVERPTKAQADRAVEALDELPLLLDALEKRFAAKLPVLRRRVAAMRSD